MECASAGSCLAESLVIAAEKKKILEVVAMAQSAQLGMPGVGNPQQSTTFQASKETKRIQIDESNPERTAIIGAGLDKNRKASSSTSSVRIGISLHGPIRTCRVFRGSWLSIH